MGKIMEAVFCVFYLIFTAIAGVRILQKGHKTPQYLWFGILSLTLVFGDAFHLVPRILAAIHPTVDYSFSLGIGKMITSITMTLFYFLLYFVYEMRYEKKNGSIRLGMGLLGVLRIVLCLLPQNDWTGDSPVIWGIYRNIPFAIMGLVMIVLFAKQRTDRPYKWMWLAILLSFAFYIPVVLWADVHAMIGMLMLPKTCMYMWIVIMGFKQAKLSEKTDQ